MFFFYFRGKCVVNYHMVLGNCQGKKIKHKFILETKGIRGICLYCNLSHYFFIFSLPFGIFWDKLFV